MSAIRPERYGIANDLYVLPTPGGAYFAVSSTEDSQLRRLLLALLKHQSSPKVDAESVCSWLKIDDEQAALEVLYRAQTLGWVQGYDERHDVSEVGVGKELDSLLPHLSSAGQAMIVDWNGLTLASTGLIASTADTLAALAADLIGVQERHAGRLGEYLGETSHGWAAVDAYGSSRIGAWPLYIGDKRILLVILGEPLFNHPRFLALIWLLINHYG